MTEHAIHVLANYHRQALAVADIVAQQGLWDSASACPGWTVKDVFSHLAQMFHALCEPDAMPAPTGTAERDADAAVNLLRNAEPATVITRYRQWATAGLRVLTHLQTSRPNATIGMADLGVYRRHLLADAYAFDHYCHLNVDVLGEDGPVSAVAADIRQPITSPVLTWMFAGLPQMCATPLRDVLTGPVRVQLDGPAGRSWVLHPTEGGTPAVAETYPSPVATTVHSSTEDFVVWGTQRRQWNQMPVTTTGDTALAHAVLDAINIV